MGGGKAIFKIPRHYHLPRKVVVKSLEVLDGKDSPDRPGMMYETTLRSMVSRFDQVFDPKMSEIVARSRDVHVENVMEHLHKHTRRRRGDAVLNDGFVEWEQTSRVYELFSVDLNVFERIFFTVDVGETTSVLSQLCSYFLIFMILVSIFMWMLSTLPELNKIPSNCRTCQPEPEEIFKIVERISVYVFTAEYLVRILTVHSVRFALLDERFLQAVLTGTAGVFAGAPALGAGRSTTTDFETPRFRLQLDGRVYTSVKYFFRMDNLIDLFAIMPFWIEEISGSLEGGGALMVLRVLRLTRVFRVFKLGKYNEVFNLFSRVIHKSTPALSLMLFFISLGCCLFGTLIWFTEQGTWHPEGHPELIRLNISKRGAYLRIDGLMSNKLEESPFYSIIHAFWYIIVTITTVGYGDLAPNTPAGKFIGSLTILNGVIVLALPVGVVGTNFSTEYYKVLEEKKHRSRLKEQLDQLAAVEEEQDAALGKENFEGGDRKGASLQPVALEIHRIDGAREELVEKAELLERQWQAVLPAAEYKQLTTNFLQFVTSLLAASTSADTGKISAKPVISAARLAELDALGAEVHAAIAAAMSLEDGKKFGIREALDCRRSWAAFEERCWDYAIDLCRVERVVEAPEYYQMKAQLLRSFPLSKDGAGRESASLKVIAYKATDGS